MVKVLVIITTAFVPYGGLTTVAMNYYRHIDKTRFHIDFASTNKVLDSKLSAELEQNESKYYCLGNRKKDIFSYARKLNQVIKDSSYDVIHVNSNSATAAMELWIAKKNGVQKRIVHNHTSICDHKILNNLMKPFFDRLYTDTVACSVKAGEWLFGKVQFHVLNNGIDAEHYRYDQQKRREIRDKYGINESTVVIGHLGKIYKPKNHHYIVEIFDKYHKMNSNSCLFLVGDGEMRGEIEEDVRQRKLENEVIFTGMQIATDAYLAAMDIFVFPSIWEGMPLSLIEAQASGLYCLASDTIDEKVVVTKTVKRLSINNGTEPWIDALKEIPKTDRTMTSEENIKMIIDAGYNANENAGILEDIYKD